MNELERKKEEFRKIIRKYNTSTLLEFFSMKSIEAYQDGKKAFSITDVPYYNWKTGERGVTKNFCFGQWELVQICYYSIKYSNDYRGIDVNESAFYQLLNENKIYDELLENIEIGMDPIKIFEHLQCLTNVQFDFQTLQTVNKFNRMYQIMININKNRNYNQTEEVSYIDFESQFEQVTGINIKKYIMIYHLIIILCAARKKTNLYDLINDIQFNIEELGFTKEDIIKVIKQESRDYNFYKRSDNWNALKYYPIVQTSKDENKYVISNIFSLMLSFPDSIYWIIRNHFYDIKSNKFTIYFGKCFEYYFQEVLESYDIEGEKLEESKKQKAKMPDWKIETEKYIFLIEQKAALFPIDARTTTKEERYAKIENFFDKNLVKAFKQLNAYTVGDTNKIVIRICLTYEKIYMEENVKNILELRMKFQSEKALNWIVNIDEMEILMYLLSNDEKRFNEIIEQKINLERAEDPNGRNFEKLLAGCTYDYTVNKINHFDRLANELKQKLSEL